MRVIFSVSRTGNRAGVGIGRYRLWREQPRTEKMKMKSKLAGSFVLAAVAAASPAMASTFHQSIDNLPSAVYTGSIGAISGASQVLGAQPAVIGATIYDAGGFESYANGNLVGQNGWGSFPSPLTTGTFTVGATSGVGGTKGVTLHNTTTTGTSSYAFPTAPYAPAAGEGISVNADLGRTFTSSSTTSSNFYGVEVFDNDTGDVTSGVGLTRAATPTPVSVGVFVIAPFNTATSQFQAGAPLFAVTIASGLSQSTYYNLEQRIDYGSKTYAIYSNGSLILGSIPFGSTAAGSTPSSTFSDADLYIGTGKSGDNGFADNYSVKVIATPEPMTLGAISLGGLMLGRRRKA